MKTKKLNLEELQKIGGGFDGVVRDPRNPNYNNPGNVGNNTNTNTNTTIVIITNFLRWEKRIWWR